MSESEVIELKVKTADGDVVKVRAMVHSAGGAVCRLSQRTPSRSELRGATAKPTLLATAQFKVKKTTKIGKILKAYAKSKGTEMNNYRFMLDGDRINDALEKTVKQFELEDGDAIDAFIEQQGGNDDQDRLTSRESRVMVVSCSDSDSPQAGGKLQKLALRHSKASSRRREGAPSLFFVFLFWSRE